MSESELEALCLELLEIDSQIGNEATLCRHVETWCSSRSFHEVIRTGDNLALLPHAPRPGVPKIMLLGHLDTVPSSGENLARVDALRIFGLGASDMKCADAVLLSLLAKAANHPARVDLVGVLYAREEGPFSDSGFPEIMEGAPHVFEGVDLAVAMEPTDNAIELGCLGTLHARATFHGTRAHSARPWQGHNAIHATAPLLQALSDLKPREVIQHEQRFVEVCSATMMDFEGARNVVPGTCSVNVNFRYGPDRTPQEAIDWIRNWIRSVSNVSNPAMLDIELRDVCPSGRVCGDNEHMLSLQNVRTPALPVAAKQAWTDVGRLSNLGMDAINFGPGSGSQAHQVGEWCLKERVHEAHHLLQSWLWG